MRRREEDRAARRATNGMRQPLSPMSANGSATTENEKPKPPASASIDAAYARAPSGASSITAMPATVAVVITNAALEHLRAGEDDERRRDGGDRARDRGADDADEDRPAAAAPVGERGGERARAARRAAVMRERDAERRVGRVERVADRAGELAEQRARERRRPRPRPTPVASSVACSGVNATGGSPTTPRGGSGAGAPVERVPAASPIA